MPERFAWTKYQPCTGNWHPVAWSCFISCGPFYTKNKNIDFNRPLHDWVTKKMSPNFFQYSCGFAGFLEQNPKNGFTVDVQTANRSKIRQSGASAWKFRPEAPLFCVLHLFSRCQKCRSFRQFHRQIDESPKRANFKPSRYKGVVRPFLEPPQQTRRGDFSLPPSHTLPPNTLPAGKEQDTLRS